MVSEESSSQSQVLKLIEEKDKIEKEIETHGLVLKNVRIVIFTAFKEFVKYSVAKM